MIKADLKSISYEIERHDSYFPEDAESFWVFVELGVGVLGEDGVDFFHLYVTTPAFLQKQFAVYDYTHIQWGHHILIVSDFNKVYIENEIKKTVEANSMGVSWVEIAKKLAKYFYWEFDELS